MHIFPAASVRTIGEITSTYALSLIDVGDRMHMGMDRHWSFMGRLIERTVGSEIKSVMT